MKKIIVSTSQDLIMLQNLKNKEESINLKFISKNIPWTAVREFIEGSIINSYHKNNNNAKFNSAKAWPMPAVPDSLYGHLNYFTGVFDISLKNGLFHSDQGPAIVGKAGKRSVQVYCKNGKLHREDGPAIEVVNGIYKEQYWLINDLYHREDGPAYESPGTKIWYNNGYKHNLDGPAEARTGIIKFFINGKEISRQEKRIAFMFFVDGKKEELQSYMSCIALKYGL